MALDDAPDAIRRGIVGSAFVEHGGCTERESADDQPRAHHPAHVCEPEQDFAFAQVEQMREVLRGLQREAGVIMDGAFGTSGGARRIDDETWVHRIGRLNLNARRLSCDEPIPEESFAAAVCAEPAYDHDLLDASGKARRLARE